MSENYPGTLPCPMIEGFSIDVDAGAIRSKERGYPAQRRVFTTMPHSVKLKFALSLREWGYWQEWMTKTGTSWFWIDIPSMYAGLHSQRTLPHLVRITSVINIDAKTNTHVFASVTVETSPSTIRQYLEAV